MTIYLDSRYATGTLFRAKDARTNSYVPTVFRVWPNYGKKTFFYEVTEVDRMENLAVKFLGNPAFWWKIMDLNPEVLDPFNVAPGTLLRIPYGS